jgi:hypothetical protein
MIVAAAILGLGYLGLAMQNQLSVLAGGVKNENILDQKIQNAWDTFFEGIERFLNGEEEATETNNSIILLHDLADSLHEMGVSSPYFAYAFTPYIHYSDGSRYSLGYHPDHQGLYFENPNFRKLFFFLNATRNLYEPRQLLQHPSYYPESTEYTQFMEQIEDAYNSEGTIADRLVALKVIAYDIQSSENYDSLSEEYHDGSNDSELSVLYSHIDYYLYKIAYPDFELDSTTQGTDA